VVNEFNINRSAEQMAMLLLERSHVDGC